jgi:gamma-glutamylcyclotransferase (GGCT)/AIG2-like uncharacterized protein YtfP
LGAALLLQPNSAIAASAEKLSQNRERMHDIAGMTIEQHPHRPQVWIGSRLRAQIRMYFARDQAAPPSQRLIFFAAAVCARMQKTEYLGMLLFVYGTLRRGGSNHGELRDARFAGVAQTQPRYELVDLGGYPALIEGGQCSVSGELYEVDAALLCELDRFEEVPVLYERKRIALEPRTGQPRFTAHAEAYVMERDRAQTAPPIASGDWSEANH